MKQVLFILFLVILNLSFSQTKFSPEVFAKGKDRLNYQILFPNEIEEVKKYPLVLFLHGAGERGDDNELQLLHGSALFLDEQNQKDYPAVIVFPQCPQESYWSNVDRNEKPNYKYKQEGDPTNSMKMLLSLVDSLATLSFVDPDRMYVMGLSMGGMGTFEILYRRPDLFAAAIPICGGGHPAMAKEYANKVAIWVFHGARDNVVLPSYSTEMVIALIKAGGNPKYTLYKDANHNSWDATFSERELLPWLFSNKK